jgi:uncharacterized membrane protein
MEDRRIGAVRQEMLVAIDVGDDVKNVLATKWHRRLKLVPPWLARAKVEERPRESSARSRPRASWKCAQQHRRFRTGEGEGDGRDPARLVDVTNRSSSRIRRRHVETMSLDFNEFQAVRRRQKVDSNSVDKASARAEPEPLAPKPTPVDTVPGSGISARAGDFVELIEVQLLIVGLILLDVVASVFELLVMCGGGDTPTLVNTVVRILQARARSLSLSVERKSLGGGDSARAAKTRSPSQSFTGFSVFFFALEMATLLVAFGGAFFVQPGYVLDMVVVAVCLYSELFGEMKGASDVARVLSGRLRVTLTRASRQRCACSAYCACGDCCASTPRSWQVGSALSKSGRQVATLHCALNAGEQDAHEVTKAALEAEQLVRRRVAREARSMPHLSAHLFLHLAAGRAAPGRQGTGGRPPQARNRGEKTCRAHAPVV